MSNISERNQQIIAEVSSRLMQLWEERQGDFTKDPIDAETFFDDLEMKAEDIDPVFAHLINFYAVNLYGTTPIANNRFLED